ncbi:endonuclease domain-containing protein [Terrarubrum flagellatum]|uniref:endonuclease domain-containing protein n=1 Tax=Terrirubrum flagellatum TaxID=2895980 RepID=UPI003145521E
MSRRVDTEHREFAKTQRTTMSAAERVIWNAVRAGRLDGWKFKRQIPFGRYVVDFVCFEARLIVETDGPMHDSDDARRHDARRDAFLRSEGFSVLRLPNNLVLGAPDIAAQRVVEALTASRSQSNAQL